MWAIRLATLISMTAGLGCAVPPVLPALPGQPAPGASPGASASASDAPAPAPVASPTPRPVDQARRPAAPLTDTRARFGVLDGAWQANERLAIYGWRERIGSKRPGGMTSYYVQVDGEVYALHWDEAPKMGQLTPGITVNLHPGDAVACIEDASQASGQRCWRMMKVYPAPKRIPPLSVI